MLDDMSLIVIADDIPVAGDPHTAQPAAKLVSQDGVFLQQAFDGIEFLITTSLAHILFTTHPANRRSRSRQSGMCIPINNCQLWL